MSKQSNCMYKLDVAYVIGFIVLVILALVVGIGYLSVTYNGYDHIINERKVEG